jgi:hypothetical protein
MAAQLPPVDMTDPIKVLAFIQSLVEDSSSEDEAPPAPRKGKRAEAAESSSDDESSVSVESVTSEAALTQMLADAMGEVATGEV